MKITIGTSQNKCPLSNECPISKKAPLSNKYTRKTCFYCHFIGNAVCKPYNGTKVQQENLISTLPLLSTHPFSHNLKTPYPVTFLTARKQTNYATDKPRERLRKR